MRTLIKKKRVVTMLALGLVAMMVVGSQVSADRRRRGRRPRVTRSEIKGVVSMAPDASGLFEILDGLVLVDGSNARVRGVAGGLDEVWEGDEVEIKGSYDANSGAIAASEIEDKGPTKDGTLKGALESVDPVDPLTGTVTLLGQVIEVDELTLIEGHHHAALDLQDLFVGQNVEIDVIVDLDFNVLYALKVEAKH